MHDLQVQLSPLHFLMWFWNIARVGEFFIPFGSVFQIMLPLKTKEFVPKVEDDAFGRFNNIS